MVELLIIIMTQQELPQLARLCAGKYHSVNGLIGMRRKNAISKHLEGKRAKSKLGALQGHHFV